MPVFTRLIAFPLEFTAENEVAADRDAMDHAIAAVEHIEARDVTGSLTVGKVTADHPAAARADWLVVYGAGPLALEKVAQWHDAGLGVDSRIVRGMWVHRPASAPAGTEATA